MTAPSPGNRAPSAQAETATLPPAPAEAAAAPPAGVPGYEVLEELDRGGMGVVYRARQIKLNRFVALKMILAGSHAGPRELIRFRIEAEAVARLQHPNVVQIYEVGELDGRPFLSLEFVDGGSLAKKLKAGPLSLPQAAELIETLARAMHYAHQRGILHRDLKPANVLLTAGGTPKITDFGLAKQLDSAADNTQSGAILGTPSYMVPEQAGGKRKEVGPATDVYALSAVLYELLTGRPPFLAETPLETVLQVISEEPPPPRRLRPHVPRALETICLKGLEKEPRRRYASALELAEDLERYRAGEPILARPPGPLGRLERWERRRPALAATLAALLVFYANHLNFLLVLDLPGEGSSYHWFVTGLVLTWGLGAAAFDWLSRRPRWGVAATYGWCALDVLLYTALLMKSDGPKSALVVGNLLLLGGAALRCRVALVWFVTALCAAGYLWLIAAAAWWWPDLLVEVHRPVIFVVCLGLMGLILHLILRRVRASSPSAGTP